MIIPYLGGSRIGLFQSKWLFETLIDTYISIFLLCPFEWMMVYLIQSTSAEIKRGKKKLHSFFYTYTECCFPGPG